MIDWERVGRRIALFFAAVIGIIISAYLLIVYVIPYLLMGIMAVAAVVALGFSCYNFVNALRDNINFFRWEWDYGDAETREPARRSYFFGPGYIQMARTIQSAFVRNVASGRRLCSSVWEWGSRSRVNRGMRILALVLSAIFIAFLCVCFFVVSMLVCAGFSVIFGLAVLLVMLITYVVYMIAGALVQMYLRT